MKKLLIVIFIGISFNLFSQDIFSACEDGNLDQVTNFIENIRVDIDVVDRNGNTPLIIASYASQYEIVRYLIEQGGNINVSNNREYTALAGAIENSDYELVKLLLENGCEFYKLLEITNAGKSTIQYAVQFLYRRSEENTFGAVNIVKLLYEYNQSLPEELRIEINPDDQRTYFYSIINDTETIDSTIKAGNEIDGVIYVAILASSLDILELLLDYNLISVDESLDTDPLYKANDDNTTPYQIAEKYNREAVIELFDRYRNN